MDRIQKGGFPVVGAIFLALGAFKFVQGEGWVVWVLIGILFGGLGAFGWLKRKR